MNVRTDLFTTEDTKNTEVRAGDTSRSPIAVFEIQDSEFEFNDVGFAGEDRSVRASVISVFSVVKKISSPAQML